MAKIFDTSKQTIGCHLSNISKDLEPNESTVVKEILTTVDDDKVYKTRFYNLDAINGFFVDMPHDYDDQTAMALSVRNQIVLIHPELPRLYLDEERMEWLVYEIGKQMEGKYGY